MQATSVGDQPDRAIRPDSRDDRCAAGTNGADLMMNGLPSSIARTLSQTDWSTFRTGWVVVMPVAIVVVVVNALSMIADIAVLPTWQPWIWEATSGLMIALLLWLPWCASEIAKPLESWSSGWRSRWRFLVVHGVAFLLFALLHVAGFVLLRHWAYWLLGGGTYDFGAPVSRFIYELRKDLLSYVAFVAVFSIVALVRKRAPMPVKEQERSFDIKDGPRIVRVPVQDILAVASAGNYVEFHLANGKQILMRATLGAIESQLSPVGLVRTHRSWLVNGTRVTALRPEGSGDWTVLLGLLEVPVSRRFRIALNQLRNGL